MAAAAVATPSRPSVTAPRQQHGRSSSSSRRRQTLLLVATLLAAAAAPKAAEAAKARAAAQQQGDGGNSISLAALPLPVGSRPEGIALGNNGHVWVAALGGAIIAADPATGATFTVHRENGTNLSGAKYCKKQDILFVAGTLSGSGFAYHLRRVAAGPNALPLYQVARVETLRLGAPGASYINDVALAPDRVYFTDSFKPLLYSVPRFASAVGGAAPDAPKERPVTQHALGKAFATKPGQFRANGVALYEAQPGADVLLVSNTHTGNLYRVSVPTRVLAGGRGPTWLRLFSQQFGWGGRSGASNPSSGASLLLSDALPDVSELALADQPGRHSKRMLVDGIAVVENGAAAFVADNYNNRIFKLYLGPGASGATPACVIDNPALAVPTTLAWREADARLWAVNSHFDTCFPFLPCPKGNFELLAIDPAAHCRAIDAPAQTKRRVGRLFGILGRRRR